MILEARRVQSPIKRDRETETETEREREREKRR